MPYYFVVKDSECNNKNNNNNVQFQMPLFSIGTHPSCMRGCSSILDPQKGE